MVSGNFPNSTYHLPLMGVSLQDGATCANHFSRLSPQVSGNTDLIITTMRSGQFRRVRQCSLSRGLPGSIHIDHQPVVPQAGTSAPWWSGCLRSRHQILLKQGSQRLNAWLIKRGKKRAEGRSMRQGVSTEQCHQGFTSGAAKPAFALAFHCMGVRS
jgi:hypothetical protein